MTEIENLITTTEKKNSYNESQKRAIYNYRKKMKEQGESHYNKEKHKLYCSKWLIENRVNCSLKSRAEIKNELQQKGVHSTIIENQLLCFYSDNEEQEVFDKIFEKKFGTKTNIDKKEQLKIYNYFQRRGFSYHIIKDKFNI